MFLHNRFVHPATALLVVVFGVALFALPATSLSTGSPGVPSERQVSPGETSTPSGLLFVENAGQWPEAARFQVWGSPAGVGTTWLAEDAIWIVVASGKLQVARSPGAKRSGGSEAPADRLATCRPATCHSDRPQAHLPRQQPRRAHRAARSADHHRQLLPGQRPGSVGVPRTSRTGCQCATLPLRFSSPFSRQAFVHQRPSIFAVAPQVIDPGEVVVARPLGR